MPALMKEKLGDQGDVSGDARKISMPCAGSSGAADKTLIIFLLLLECVISIIANYVCKK